MKTVWTVTTSDTGDGMEPTIDVCEKLETAKRLALELLDVDAWHSELEDDDELMAIMEVSISAVRKFDGGGGFLQVGYFDGNMGKLWIQAAVLR